MVEGGKIYARNALMGPGRVGEDQKGDEEECNEEKLPLGWWSVHCLLLAVFESVPFPLPSECDNGPRLCYVSRAVPRSGRVDGSQPATDNAHSPPNSAIPSPSPSLPTMADDFARLVFQSNPATSLNSQYQRANDGYPPGRPPRDPSHASPQLLDPFFDDEEEGDTPYSAFAAAHSMQAKESKQHLPGQAAPLAGTSKSSLPTDGVPQGWTFDQDDPPVHAPPPSTSRESKKAPRRKWKWPWQKETVLMGERVVALNNSDANAIFLSNYVSTTKYNMATFVPKFLFG